MVLLINACVRSQSRTKRLADELMKKLGGPVREVRLWEIDLPLVDEVFIQRREELVKQGRPVFVDTNISPETLRRISDDRHVLILLADPEISVRRFFEREDREKQFLYRLLLEEPDPEAALANFRECLSRVNSRANYERFLRSGFPVLLREERRTPARTLALAEQIFSLREANA